MDDSGLSHVDALLGAHNLAYLDGEVVRRNGLSDWSRLISAVEDAYHAHAAGDVRMPMSQYLRYPDRPSYDRIIPLLGYLGGRFRVSGLKEICSGAGNHAHGFPRASGLIVLNDPTTGRPFALMEGSLISAARTAAVTGLAMRKLVSPRMKVLALLGCGQLATEHLAMIADVFGVERFAMRLYDPDAERLGTLARVTCSRGMKAEAVGSAQEALQGADIVITATTAEEPYIHREDLTADALYLAVSLLDAHLDVFLAAETILVDDLQQCLHEGRPLHRLAEQGRLPQEKVFELGKWLKEPSTPERWGLTVFNPMGTVITDLAVAKTIFDAASAANDFTRLPL
jgi:ornithine cyclodeaminase